MRFFALRRFLGKSLWAQNDSGGRRQRRRVRRSVANKQSGKKCVLPKGCAARDNAAGARFCPTVLFIILNGARRYSVILSERGERRIPFRNAGYYLFEILRPAAFSWKKPVGSE